jgi:hypothetical protein
LECSPIKRLLVQNDRNYDPERPDKSDVNKGRTTTYPNLGIGAVRSSMTKFGGKKNLLVECKAYFSGSEDYRHPRKSPFYNSSYSAGAIPMAALLESSEMSEKSKNKILST